MQPLLKLLLLDLKDEFTVFSLKATLLFKTMFSLFTGIKHSSYLFSNEGEGCIVSSCDNPPTTVLSCTNVLASK